MELPGIHRDGYTGRAMIAGTDVAVSDVLAQFSVGASPGEIVARYPGLTLEGVAAAVRFAAVQVDREIPYAPQDGGDLHVHERPLRAEAWDPPGGATVVVAADEYDDLVYRVDVLQGLVAGLSDAACGRTIPHEQVAAELLARFSA